MPGILRDLRIKTASPQNIRLIRLPRKPVGKQTPRRGITGTGKRLLKRRPRSGGIKRRERSRIQQSRLRLLPRLRISGKKPLQARIRRTKLPDGKLRLGHPQQQGRVSRKRPIRSRLIMFERLFGLPRFQQCRTQAHPMLDGRRPIEIDPRLAYRPVGIHQLRNRPRRSPPTARFAQARQINRKQIHEAAQQRKSKQQQQPVHILVSAHHMHGKKQRNDDVKTDSEK